MPELPEVETVRRGLRAAFEGARIADVRLARPDLRFPFPEEFGARLTGVRVGVLRRRGKYLLAELDSGETLILHLGMSGRFTVLSGGAAVAEGAPAAVAADAFHHQAGGDPRHDHVKFALSGPAGDHVVVYNDPRRFGFMDLAKTDGLAACRHFAEMGPEPLSGEFTDLYFERRLKGRATPVKAAILDQSVVAGVGNIYACEALHRAGISPRRKADSVAGARSARLRSAIVEVLEEAIAAGGSTLRDFAGADGALGYFQHKFDVYDRAGEACRQCGTAIARFVQAGRSTFACGGCQR